MEKFPSAQTHVQSIMGKEFYNIFIVRIIPQLLVGKRCLKYQAEEMGA